MSTRRDFLATISLPAAIATRGFPGVPTSFSPSAPEILQSLSYYKGTPGEVAQNEDYWSEVIDFEALVRHGTIDAADVDLVLRTDSVDAAYDVIVRELTEHALPLPGPIL